MGKARSREQSEVKVSWQCPRGSGGRWRESVKQALCLLLRSVDGHHRCPGRIHFFCSLLLVIFSCPVSSLLHHAGTPVWSAGTVSSWLCENSSTSLATWRLSKLLRITLTRRKICPRCFLLCTLTHPVPKEDKLSQSTSYSHHITRVCWHGVQTHSWLSACWQATPHNHLGAGYAPLKIHHRV